MNQPTRRGVLYGLVTGAAVVASGTAAASGSAIPLVSPGVGNAPWWILNPMKRGSQLKNGWFIQDLSGVRQGASILTVKHAQHGIVDVHLCAHDGQPKGVVYTALVDLVVMDGGNGDKATNESLGRMLMDLAKRMHRNELAEFADLRPLSHMLKHDQRMEAYGPENL